jgi:two-component system response regulator AtoC
MRILIVEDDLALGELLERHCQERGHSVDRVCQASECLDAVDSLSPDCVFLDVRLRDGNGLDLVPVMKARRKEVRVTVMTGYEPLATVSHATARGAEYFLQKPLRMDELDEVLSELERRAPPGDPRTWPAQAPEGFVSVAFSGTSRRMTDVCRSVGLAARSRVTTLIEGESGVGKELAARAIHSLGGPGRPFAAVDCATIVETLFESELFGHERGAFTGAHSARRGKVQMAEGGILFLDEVAELTPRMQSKLLRLLQTRTFERVGGSEPIQVDFQLVAATNRNIRAMAHEGTFREDLYHRLNVLAIHIPPLRDRREDIPALVSHILSEIPARVRIPEPSITPEALSILVGHDWPGNVRELENTLTRLALEREGRPIDLESVKQGLGDWRPRAPGMKLVEVERSAILAALKYTRWNLGQACELLGISRPTLRRKISRYSLSR